MAQITARAARDTNDLAVLLGDAGKAAFCPKMHLSRWGGECTFELEHDISDVAVADRAHSEANGKHALETPAYVHEFYERETSDEHPEGGYEFAITLKAKPKSNVIELKIKTAGLVFLYQPPLTDEWRIGQRLGDVVVGSVTETEARAAGGALLARRPENVVGSYAVYHASRRNDYSRSGGKNYRAGKAFHIYRPQLIDADGKTSWAALAIDAKAGRMTITADEAWLAKAAYPVVVDPTFGYTTAGASDFSNASGNILCQPYALSEAGTAQSMSVRAKYGWNSGMHMQLAVYSTAATPAREDYTGSTTLDAANSWKTINVVGGTSLAAGNHWLCINDDSDCTIAYDSGGHQFYNYMTQAFGSWPATLSLTEQGWGDPIFSIYVTYTAGSAAKSVTDAGTGADSVSVRAVVGLADVGAGADAVAQALARVPVADFGAGQDAIASILAALGLSDSGVGSDAAVIKAIAALSDLGAAIEAVSVVIHDARAVSDAGAGADAVNVAKAASVLLSDSGTGVDAVASIVARILLSDSCLGADLVAAINAHISVADLGAGADVVYRWIVGTAIAEIIRNIFLKSPVVDVHLEPRAQNLEVLARVIDVRIRRP